MTNRIVVPLPRFTVPDENRSVKVEILYFKKLTKSGFIYSF